MASHFLASSGFNLLDGATITPTNEDALFPKANLYANRPSRPFKFSAAGADDRVTIDLLSAKSVDVVSIHGHNLDSGITDVHLRSSTDNFAASNDLEATITVATPTFYGLLSSPVSRRYWRVRFSGTNGNPISVGELVLGDSTQFTVDKRLPYEIRYRRRQIRNQTRAGELHVFNISDFEERVYQLSFKPGTDAAMEQVRDSIYQATGGGATPLVYVPDDTREEVIFGHVDNAWEVQRLFTALYQHQLIISELPMGVSVT